MVIGHRPFYCNEVDPSTCVNSSTGPADCRCQAQYETSRTGSAVKGESYLPVEPLFYEHGVDLAIYGHVHDYSRFLPVYNRTVRADAANPYVDPQVCVCVIGDRSDGGGQPVCVRVWCTPPGHAWGT